MLVMFTVFRVISVVGQRPPWGLDSFFLNSTASARRTAYKCLASTKRHYGWRRVTSPDAFHCVSGTVIPETRSCM